MIKTKSIFFFFTFLFLIANYSYSQSNNDVNTHVTVDFKIRNLGFNVDGYFKDTKMNVLFNKNDLANSSISGKVSVKSINTDIEKRDEHLKQEDYFDAKKYPYILFKSSKIIFKSGDTYNVTGELTIKNTTKEITIPFKIKNTTSGLELSTYFEINRRDYKVGGSSFALSNTAKISITYLKK
ncbi:YceI family protein [uncultured Lacinutrix sp.]|uniref:YceI family protein n=1 Tax=uncultured Lacinutrix sp. TaxID=574032 RepID=UPI002639B676|nr:YceI family protein [uncultured Lacinutrix sp.]